MTNLIFSLVITLATNWTGNIYDNQELGYVKTNHTLNVAYKTCTNSFLLLSEPSSIAVWRPSQTISILDLGLTNLWFTPISNYWLHYPPDFSRLKTNHTQL